MAEVKPPTYLPLLESGEYSDFVIECQGIEFKVHRAIVCSQSTMLQKAASGPFKEAEAARINLTEEDPGILSRVLLFLYTNDYEAKEDPSVSSVLKVHALVFKYADMLDIEQLKKIASRRFLGHVHSACTSPGFAEPLKVMYESTRSDDQYLRLPVTKICVAKHLDIVRCEDTLAVIKEYEPNVWNIAVPLLKEMEITAQTELGEAVAAGETALQNAVAVGKTAQKDGKLKAIKQVNEKKYCWRHPHRSVLQSGAGYTLDNGETVVAYCSSCPLSSHDVAVYDISEYAD